MKQGPRATLAFTLNCLAFALAVSAITTSYWCSGTRKVVKPLCTGPVKVKQNYCIHFNSSEVNNTRVVQYINENGEEQFIMKQFHTGIWFTCEQAIDLLGFTCRAFLEIAPTHERGVLWLCIIGECLYIILLFIGVSLMAVERSHCCNMMNRLKLTAFAALCTALSGLFGMVAHMMFTTAFQLAVIMGPEDWKPKTWDYSWSYLLAWVSFATCMASAVTSLNHYTKTMIQFRFKQKHIKNNLELLGFQMPVGLWDTYMSSSLDPADQHLSFEVNVHRLLYSSSHDAAALHSQGEKYC
ncbi:germ cell-specificprotein 1-like protein isoform X1 [Silurus asotus]|uniref:Germ cell-specificprotein 1-like protein isoform X1 n=1 Tax=Silurus asotus TaxID=30991 RepID=A0AAD5AN15_SILAS|nr:germ cell-specificprotein 1-like protein isoform X1 [Silurus asotus]